MKALMPRLMAGVLVATALGLGLAPAGAQQAPAPSKDGEQFTAAQLAAAKAAIVASQSTVAFDDILPAVATRTKTLFTRSNPLIAADIDTVTDQVAIKLAARRPDLDRLIEEVWARRFSIDEMNQIAAFFNSPVGVKFAQFSPEIAAMSLGAARQWEDQLSTEMVVMVRDELRKQGHNL